MALTLVTQLQFARQEFQRCLEGLSAQDAVRRIEPANSISWIVGHLANQEQSYWLYFAQGKLLVPGLRDLVGTGRPATTPPLDEMWDAWQTITYAADEFLSTLTAEQLLEYFEHNGQKVKENIATLLLRNTYHYWFHTGEVHAIRQLLGHPNLPQFVGSFGEYAYTKIAG